MTARGVRQPLPAPRTARHRRAGAPTTPHRKPSKRRRAFQRPGLRNPFIEQRVGLLAVARRTAADDGIELRVPQSMQMTEFGKRDVRVTQRCDQLRSRQVALTAQRRDEHLGGALELRLLDLEAPNRCDQPSLHSFC